MLRVQAAARLVRVFRDDVDEDMVGEFLRVLVGVTNARRQLLQGDQPDIERQRLCVAQHHVIHLLARRSFALRRIRSGFVCGSEGFYRRCSL